VKPLSSPRPLSDLNGDTAGQAVTEYAMLMGFVVIPILLFIPVFLNWIDIYFYRVAEVISLPFP
jgi:hypothetical protein